MGAATSSRPARPLALAVVFAAGLMTLAWAWPLHAGDMPGQGAWLDMVQGISQWIDLRGQEVAAMRDKNPGLLAGLEADLADINDRFNQLQLLQGVAGASPWSERTILAQYLELRKYLNIRTGKLSRQREKLLRLRGQYATLLDIQEQGAPAQTSPADKVRLGQALEHLKTMRTDEEALLREVDAGLAKAATVMDRIAAGLERGGERYKRLLVAYVSGCSEALFTANGLETAWLEMRGWANDFFQFNEPLLRWVPWGQALAYNTVLLILLYFVGPAAWRIFTRRGDLALMPRRGPGWFLLCLGLVWSVSSRLGLYLFGFNPFIDLAAISLASLGMVMLLEGSRSKLDSGLFTLWALFAALALLEALAIPPAALGLFCAASCALVAWRLHVIRQAQELATPRGVLVALMSLMALAALAGFGTQIMLLAQALFMLLLTLRVVDATKRLLLGTTGEASNAAGPSRLSVVAYPLAAALLGFSYIMWLFMFLGGPPVLHHMLNRQWTIGSLSLSIEALGMILILFFAVRLVVTGMDLGAAHVRFQGKSLNPALEHTLKAAVSYLAWILFALAALYLLGVPMNSLTWIASGLSVGVGFGLKDIVNNFISGLIILFGGAIKKGDVIQQGKNLGEVIDISVRNTTIRTPDNTMVIIPNSTFLRGEIVNLSYQDAKTRLTVAVTVVPGSKPKKIRKILLDVAKENANVLKKPAPEASLVRFGRLGLDFELYVWVEDFLKKYDVEAELVTEIDKRFQDDKIMLAFQGVKFKYKPKGSEERQLETRRQELRDKRREVFSRVRSLRRRTNTPGRLIDRAEN